ncbi:MAG: UDP-glucose--hexose-1-phosphate uridylyltransferase [Spirochaetales bacterium]|nr:UDP-glucose--hexose-1-phosphate uridylyltransferase [Spirochaetales bacterium]
MESETIIDLQDHTHRRQNPLTGEWILVSPHRTKRPWQGKTESHTSDGRPEYDPGCYLCPGNTRAGAKVNLSYTGTYTFANDFAALLPDTPVGNFNNSDLLIAEGERGICRVICFSPRHDLTLPRMEISAISGVISTWQDEYSELGSHDGIGYVQIFENKGAVMGCSNPHPHGQIWANSSIPDIPQKETINQEKYSHNHDGCLLCSYLDLEIERSERIVAENRSFVSLVPFWATWPYETMVLPRRHMTSILDCTANEAQDLAGILKKTTIKYDNLFRMSFPYSMGLHQKPTDGRNYDSWHFHLHFLPPLLRSATVKKFMVGYEMLATPQRDITAETAAENLRDAPEIHFLEAESTS